MSKKQTLKSLLGSSDDRVQVSYDPSEITLSPTVQQARGSATVVQSMPRTNQVLNFANALNQVPQVMGQMKNIGEAQALEDFSQMSDAERDAAMDDDKKISNWLGYDKAFQDSLVKDYFVRNANSITKRFTELANNPAQYESDQGFDDALTAEKQALINELSEKFGSNPNRVMAINAIGDQVVTKVIGATTEMYETNKINYALDMEGSFLSTQILEDGVDPTTAYKSYLEKIKALPGIDNKIAKENFVVHSTAIATELKNNGQYEKAKEVTKAALEYEFFKGAKVSGEERKGLSNLLNSIEDAQDTETKTKTTGIALEVRRASESISYSLLGKEIQSASINQMEDVFTLIRPNVDLDGEDVTQFFETLKSTTNPQARIRLYNDFLLQLGQGTVDGKPASDLSNEVYNLSSENLIATQINLNNISQSAVTGLDKEVSQNLIGQAYNYFTANPTHTPESMLANYGHQGAAVPRELQSIYDDVHKIDYLSEVPAVQNLTESDVKNRLSSAFSGLNATNRFRLKIGEINNSAAIASNNIYNLLVEDIRDFARNGIIKQDGEDISIVDARPEVRNKAISDFINTQMNEYVEIENELFKGRNLFSGLYDETPLTGSVNDLVTDEGVFGGKKGEAGSIEAEIEDTVQDSEYMHLKKSNIAKMAQGKFGITAGDLRNAYDTHRKNGEKNELSATMLIYGYRAGFDPQSAQDLKTANLQINEVRLFANKAEFIDVMNNQWFPVLTKSLEEPDTLTEADQETLKVLTSFGIFDTATFEYFGEVQSQFLN